MSNYDAIYRVVRRVPAGRVATYGQVAALAGLGRHARQVGYALHALPDGSDLPWQRVINARGEVSERSDGGGGREGYQRHLLEEEGVVFDSRGRVDLRRFRWEPEQGARRRRSRAARPESVAGIVAGIEALLRPLGTPDRAAGSKAYLKSELELYGLTVPDLRSAVHSWLESRPSFGRDDLLRVTAALWERPVFELRAFAIELLRAGQGLLESEDLDLVESFLRRSGTWACVDPLAVHVVGPLVERDRRVNRRLDRWARDRDFWIRRSALLALLPPLRAGGGDWERFVRYADSMLDEKEFFIRKAIGWVLREVGKRHPDRVRAFLDAREGRLSGVTLREATKYLGAPPPGATSRRPARSPSRRRSGGGRRAG